jgi:hypothetical protein
VATNQIQHPGYNLNTRRRRYGAAALINTGCRYVKAGSLHIRVGVLPVEYRYVLRCVAYTTGGWVCVCAQTGKAINPCKYEQQVALLSAETRHRGGGFFFFGRGKIRYTVAAQRRVQSYVGEPVHGYSVRVPF